MAELSGLQIFKYLPAAKKTENANCKKCGFPTCMAFALKAAKLQADITKCPFAPQELQEIFAENAKKPQETLSIRGKTIGGETVLFRHEKTFVNPTAIAILIDTDRKDWRQKLERVKNYEVKRINDTFKVDFIVVKGSQKVDLPNAISYDEFLKLPLLQVAEPTFEKTVEKLIFIRKKAVCDKDENFNKPTWVYFEQTEDLTTLCAKAATCICKYANIILLKDFDEALITTLMTLRQNIFTDPQKPLQVESKIYEFNGGGEDAILFMTTNFALTYFAVANELEAMNKPAYLIVTPSDGMSVLTAWSAEKFTAQIVAKTLKKEKIADKVKTRKIIIPGLLAHMKKELDEAASEFEFIVGTNEAYLLGDFVKNMG